MAVNKVDYEVLTSGVSVYANQAEALDEVIQALVKMNGELQGGWTNQTHLSKDSKMSTNRHLKMQEMLSRAFLISSRVTCRTDRMMMHRVQQQLEDNCKNKLGGLPVKNRQFF